MPVDLNLAQPQKLDRSSYDVDGISYALRQTAPSWVCGEFPNGRLSDDGKGWRLGDITGRAPKKQGSCVIQLEGDNAGNWYDFETKRGGGPISTLKEGLRLSNDVLKVAIEIVERYGGAAYLGGSAPRPAVQPQQNRNTALIEAQHVFEHAAPIAGTLAQTYLESRGITIDPPTDDLLFNGSTTDWATKRGEPALIARFRYPDGTPTGGIHRIYLKPDGSGYTAKKMLGPTIDGGVVMLAMPSQTGGTLGVGEGIESTLAAMQLYQCAGWATASDGSMRKFAQWLRDHPDQAKAQGIERLLVWADAGRAGEGAGGELYAAARAIGLPVRLCIPKGGDDFNDDLVKGLAPEPVDWNLEILTNAETVEPGEPEQEIIRPQSAELLTAARALTNNYDARQVSDLLKRVILAGLEKLDEQQILDAIRKNTGLLVPAFNGVVKDVRRSVAALKKKPVPNWVNHPDIAKNFFDEPAPIASNVLLALRHDSEWLGVLGFDEFSQRPMIMRSPPWDEPDPHVTYPRPFTDADEHRTLIWVQQCGVHARADAVRQAVAVAIDDNRYHPVRDYLESLKWDGQPRLNNWLTFYLGVEPIPNYTDAIGACWMISAVARIFEPGCIAKYCLILEGDQDIKKSASLRILGDPWFTDHISELGTKDSVMEAGNAWIVELAELDSARKAHNSAIKAFISRQVDKFRPPFGRHVIEQPRQCVLAGTVNPVEGIFNDASGAVRFWPVTCVKIDADALRHDRDQLWAEAVHRYRLGEKWHLDNEDQLAAAREQQELRYAADSWEANIERWLVLNNWMVRTTVSEILTAVFVMPEKDHARPAQTRVGIAMKRIGKRTGWRQDVTSRERPRPYIRVE